MNIDFCKPQVSLLFYSPELARKKYYKKVGHHFKHLFPLTVVIFMKMVTLLVPLGFQFMAMIGGKALLLSKMALLLASLQGLKNVANHGYAHGVYQQHSQPPYTDHYSAAYRKLSA